MHDEELRAEDERDIARHGLTAAEVDRQLGLLRNPPPHLRVVRPATPGDGMRVLDEAAVERYRGLHREAAEAGRLLSFVPASGAATRMFKSLIALGDEGDALERERLRARGASGDRDAAETALFLDSIERFAFADELRHALAARNGGAPASLEEADPRALLETLLGEPGLDYAAQPKGLLAFHRYPDGARTPFEEHLAEAARTARDRHGVARLHLTVSPQHRAGFLGLLERIRAAAERRLDARFEVGTSEQKPSTDTVAIDRDGRPVRDDEGHLLFRPGGHGSLIENLNDLGADLVYVKNIDNVVPDDRREPIVRWRQALAGVLVEATKRIAETQARLAGGPVPDAVAAALRFLADELCVPVPEAIANGTVEQQLAFARRKLARPVRVCGMVRAEGDPGGGPFWASGRDGEPSLQIVETAQIDRRDQAQQAVLAAATHFNPVDLILSLRDPSGRPLDLRRFVDPGACFIAEKSSAGRALLALEHPGLWNGAMSDWTTIFVEVPALTFNPVKTVNDLLRPEHQPRS
jgi:hypothetical protein